MLYTICSHWNGLFKVMDERRSFYRNNPTVKFSRGETIFLQDEMPKVLYSIKSGVVEECGYTNEGVQQSICFDIIGDIIPIGWSFAKTTKALFEYSAFTDCELYVISRDDFLSQLAYNIDFTKKMLNRMVSSLLGSTLRISALEMPSADLKIIHTFHYLSLLYGASRGNGQNVAFFG